MQLSGAHRQMVVCLAREYAAPDRQKLVRDLVPFVVCEKAAVTGGFVLITTSDNVNDGSPGAPALSYQGNGRRRG